MKLPDFSIVGLIWRDNYNLINYGKEVLYKKSDSDLNWSLSDTWDFMSKFGL